MNAATANQRLVITAASSLHQFAAHMDKMAAVLNAHAAQFERATRFIAEQYEKSAWAKQRRAKQNLTAACNAAQARVRKTLHEITATFTNHKTAPTVSEMRALVHDPHQANAPNRCDTKTVCKSAPTNKNNKGRQQHRN